MITTAFAVSGAQVRSGAGHGCMLLSVVSAWHPPTPRPRLHPGRLLQHFPLLLSHPCFRWSCSSCSCRNRVVIMNVHFRMINEGVVRPMLLHHGSSCHAFCKCREGNRGDVLNVASASAWHGLEQPQLDVCAAPRAHRFANMPDQILLQAHPHQPEPGT